MGNGEIVIVGGAHMDHAGHARGSVVMGASNPARFSSAPGGAGLNMASAIAGMGGSVRLVGPVGVDSEAGVLREALVARGIVDGLYELEGGATGQYFSAVGPDGDVVVALADLELNEAMTFAGLSSEAQAAIGAAGTLVLTANLSRSAMADFVVAGQGKMAGVTISPSKAIRLRGVLGALDWLFTNVAEAGALLRSEDSDPAVLAQVLFKAGARAGVVTNGAGLVAVWQGDEVVMLEPEVPESVVDVTGGGDALAGATLAALQKGCSFVAAVKHGLRASALTIGVKGPVAAPEALQKLSEEMDDG